MPKNFWRRILWSDEYKFELINSRRKVKVWKRRGEGLNLKTLNPTLKHSKFVIVWGCVPASCVVYLAKIESTMNAEKYVYILSNHLFQSTEDSGSPMTSYFKRTMTQNIIHKKQKNGCEKVWWN